MFLKIISSALFLPFLIVGMIIVQVHLEGYWNTNVTKWQGNLCAVFYTIFIYIVQEISIIQLTLLSLNVMAFIYVIPITMILRNEHKLWWGLLVLTPFINLSVDAYLNISQSANIVSCLLRLALVSLLCVILLRCKKLTYYNKYTIAMYSSCFIHFLVLSLRHQLKLNHVITILIGTWRKTSECIMSAKEKNESLNYATKVLVMIWPVYSTIVLLIEEWKN